MPQVTFTFGSPSPASYYIQVSWVSAAGQEGAPSILMAFDGAANEVPVIQAVNPPAGATGFNLYASLALTGLALQNISPLAVGGSFTLNQSGPVTGIAPGTGQVPDSYVTGGSSFTRG